MPRHGLTQKITYWAPGDQDRFGKRSYSAPIILMGRWEDKQEEVLTRTGETKISKSKVFLGAAVDELGYVAQGDLTAQADPTGVQAAVEVGTVGSATDMRSMSRLYTVYILN